MDDFRDRAQIQALTGQQAGGAFQHRACGIIWCGQLLVNGKGAGIFIRPRITN